MRLAHDHGFTVIVEGVAGAKEESAFLFELFRRRADAGEAGPLWITAARQTAGRGRRGRAWSTEAGNLAGKMRQQGRMWVLLPRGYQPDSTKNTAAN